MAFSATIPSGPSWPPRTHRRVRRPGYTLRFTTRPRGPSPVMRVAMAEMQAHRRRFDAARRETMRDLGIAAAQAVDGFPALSWEGWP